MGAATAWWAGVYLFTAGETEIAAYDAARAVGFLLAAFGFWAGSGRTRQLIGAGFLLAGAADIVGFFRMAVPFPGWDPILVFELVEAIGSAALVVIGSLWIRAEREYGLSSVRVAVLLIGVTTTFWLIQNLGGDFLVWGTGNVLAIAGIILIAITPPKSLSKNSNR